VLVPFGGCGGALRGRNDLSTTAHPGRRCCSWALGNTIGPPGVVARRCGAGIGVLSVGEGGREVAVDITSCAFLLSRLPALRLSCRPSAKIDIRPMSVFVFVVEVLLRVKHDSGDSCSERKWCLLSAFELTQWCTSFVAPPFFLRTTGKVHLKLYG
jgi:hypothetical protein